MNRHLVKALVSRRGHDATHRYVPLEIFDLWKSHMAAAYGYEVESATVAFWSQAGPDLPPAGAVSDADDGGEWVAQVVVDRKLGGVETQTERFFAARELANILPRFLSHYGIRPSQPEEMAAVRIVYGRLLVPGEGGSA